MSLESFLRSPEAEKLKQLHKAVSEVTDELKTFMCNNNYDESDLAKILDREEFVIDMILRPNTYIVYGNLSAILGLPDINIREETIKTINTFFVNQ